MNPTRLEKLREMEAQKPDDPFFKYAIAIEHISAGNDAAARPYFELLTEQHPDYVATYLHLGQLYERLGEYDNCLKTYRKGIEVATKTGDKKALNELNEAFFIADSE